MSAGLASRFGEAASNATRSVMPLRQRRRNTEHRVPLLEGMSKGILEATEKHFWFLAKPFSEGQEMYGGVKINLPWVPYSLATPLVWLGPSALVGPFGLVTQWAFSSFAARESAAQ